MPIEFCVPLFITFGFCICAFICWVIYVFWTSNQTNEIKGLEERIKKLITENEFLLNENSSLHYYMYKLQNRCEELQNFSSDNES